MTDGPGVAQNHVPDGVREYEKLRQAGFEEAELHAWVDQTTNRLKAAGFKPKEIEAHWGSGDPDDPRLKAWLTGNVTKNGEHIAQNPKEAFQAGWQMSDVGLIARGDRPDTAMPGKDTSLGMAASGMAGQLLGDLPASVAGFVMGAPVGARVGALAGPEGAGIGAVATGGAMSAATPEAVRQVLLDAYSARDGNVRTWQDAAKLAIEGLKSVGKAGVVGGVSGGLGGAAGGAAVRMGAGPAVAFGANTAAMVTSAATASAAFDGHMPSKNDFVLGAATALAFHAGSKVYSGVASLRVQSNLETIYRRTGLHPQDVVELARTDPAIRDELLSQDLNGEPIVPGLRSLALHDPEPFKPASREEPAADIVGPSQTFKVEAPKKVPVPPGIDENYRKTVLDPAYEALSDRGKAALKDWVEGRTAPGRRILDTDPEVLKEVYDAGQPVRDELALHADEDGIVWLYRGERNGQPANESGLQSFTTDKKVAQQRADAGPEGGTVKLVGVKIEDIVNEGTDFESEIIVRRGARASEPTAAPAKPKPIQGEVLEPAAKLPKIATTPIQAETLLLSLEGSGDHAVSPAGAIGKYQIMPGTARQYMGKDFDVQTLHDPKVNQMVGRTIIADLYKRYHGDMTAIAIAYNAGPGRAGEYLSKGEGTRLKAIPDRNARGGIRYEHEPSSRDESFLPLETQRYLANGRRRSGGEMGGGDQGGPSDRTWPSYELASGGDGAGGGKPPGGGPPGAGDKGEPGEGFWDKASEETLTGEMLANIGEEPRTGNLLNLDRIMGQYVSELTPARNIDARLLDAGLIDKKTLNTEDMFRQTYASDLRAGVFVRYGAIDPVTLDIKKGTPSVIDAVKATKEDGGNFDGWVAFMLAQRTMDKAAQGIETGFNPKAALALATNKKAQRKYARATKLFNDVMTSALEYSRDSGVHSQGQVEAMVRDNPTYISMRRIMGDDESFKPGRGFGPRDALRRMEGSDRQIVDPVRATIDNLRVIIKMADRNRAIGHIVGYAERGDYSGLKKIPWDPKATIAEAGSDTFKPYGMVNDPATLEAYGPLLAERVQKSLGQNEFIYYRNGVPEKWRAESPELAQLIKRADSVGEANIVMETAGFFAKMKRSGIVSTPGYAGRAIFRDQLAAFTLDPTHPIPFTTWMQGLFHVLKGTEVYQDAMAKGSIGGALADMDADWMARDMHRILAETGTYEGVANVVKHPIELAQLINEKLDAANRVGYYMQATAKGYDPIKAATMARKAYLDFAERATSNIVNGMAKVTPFFRPTLLGAKQFGEAIAERPVETLTFATVGLAVPTALIFMLNWMADQELPEGERWKDIPLWQRDTHLITPPIAGVRVRLPYPQETGVIFGAAVSRLMDKLANDNPRAFKGMVNSALQTYVPDLLPAIAQPAVEAQTNHSFFTGKPLVPASLENASGYMQYTPATSETGKSVARALGPAGLDIADFSPIQFDNFVRGYTGTVGTQMLKALDIPYHGEKKPYELADIPFVGSFMIRHPGTSSQPISDFYDEMHRLETYDKDFSLALKHAEQGGDADDVTANAAASEYANALAPIKETIGTMSTIIQGINLNKDMTDVEKRQSIDTLVGQMVQTAEVGLKTIDGLPRRDLHPQQTLEQPAAPQAAPVEPTPAAGAGQVPVS